MRRPWWTARVLIFATESDVKWVCQWNHNMLWKDVFWSLSFQRLLLYLPSTVETRCITNCLPQGLALRGTNHFFYDFYVGIDPIVPGKVYNILETKYFCWCEYTNNPYGSNDWQRIRTSLMSVLSQLEDCGFMRCCGLQILTWWSHILVCRCVH